MKLGRLKSLGINEPWQIPLYCPDAYRDYTNCFENFDPRYLYDGGAAVFGGRLKREPETKWKDKRPRTQFVITDGSSDIAFSLFGDTRAITAKMNVNQMIYVYGVVARIGERVYLNDAVLVSVHDVGKIIPVYKGVAGKISADNVRSHIEDRLTEALPLAVTKIRETLKEHLPVHAIRQFVRCKSMTLEEVLIQVHRPTSEEKAAEAMGVMERIANLLAAEHLIRRADEVGKIPAPPIVGMSPTELAKHIPFELTDEQWAQIMKAIEPLYDGFKLSALLSGDVGTGKTAVYGMVCAYVASSGHRAAVMLPNQNLAIQVYEELNEYFGFLGVGLITGKQQSELDDKRIIVGTTALLFRDVGEFSLVVVDEQQKMATAQREKLLSQDTSLIEVSATPIPRTMSYALYGAVTILQLKKCHVEKHIETRIYDASTKRELFHGIKATLAKGKKVLIVCPRCEEDHDDESGMISAQKLAADFERIVPGKVALSHSRLSSEENYAAIKAIKEGGAQILISTTVVEVGMTIKNLERAVVMDASRYGISTLHQIRGRVSRHGGNGNFDLYLPKPVKNADSLARLQVLVDESDGFEIAKHDLRIRGTGDLSDVGEQQHGDTNFLIKNIKGNFEQIEAIIDEVAQYKKEEMAQAS